MGAEDIAQVSQRMDRDTETYYHNVCTHNYTNTLNVLVVHCVVNVG